MGLPANGVSRLVMGAFAARTGCRRDTPAVKPWGGPIVFLASTIWTRWFGIRPSPRCRPWLGVAGDRSGTAALEFALIAPMLIMTAVGVAQVSIVFAQYIALYNNVTLAIRAFELSRLNTSTPYSSNFGTSAGSLLCSSPNLTCSSITVNPISIYNPTNGTTSTCNSDSACAALMVSGNVATATITYPCTLLIPVQTGEGKISSVSFLPSGVTTLTATTSGTIE